MSTSQDYPSVVSRTIIIPELGLSLGTATVELPAALREAASTEVRKEGDALDSMIAAEAQSALGVPWSTVLTFERWSRIRQSIGEVLGSPDFAREMQSAYAGDDTQRRKAFGAWLSDARAQIEAQGEQITDASAFAETVIRKILL